MEKNAKFKVSARILDHLGVSAYNSIKKCLVELAANAYDADATEVRITLPDVLDQNALIEISDNGKGMSPVEVEDEFLFIGRNRRESGKATTEKGRKIIGSKGIGKFAGFGIASTLELSTRKEGKLSRVTLNRKMFDDFADLAEQEIKINVSETEMENGTRILLTSFDNNLNLQEKEELRHFIINALPRKNDFVVFVNDIECTVDDIPGQKEQIAVHVGDYGEMAGFYKIAKNKQKHAGISIRVHGRIVTEPNLFDISHRSHGFFTTQKIVGEVNADFLDQFINTSRDGFLEDSPVVQESKKEISSLLSRIVQGLDETEKKERTERILVKPEISNRLEKLPPHIRGTAKSIVVDLVSKLKGVEEETSTELIEWMLRYFESNVLKELMSAIIASELADTEKLVELIKDWGLKQVNNVVDLIKAQINIIEKMEAIVASDKSLEIDVHKLIENNLWLIREGLELWSSNKQLRTVLGNHLDELYKDKKELRPDLICRSRNGNEAIIIEFKRPKEKIVMEHVTQILNYKTIIKSKFPNLKYTLYVVGKTYGQEVLDSRENIIEINFWSYSEILQKSRVRFENILKILGRE